MKKSFLPALLLVLLLATAAYADQRSWGTDAMVTTQIVDRTINDRAVEELPRQNVASGESYPVTVWASQSYQHITAREDGRKEGFRETQYVSLAGVDVHLPKLLAGISLGWVSIDGAGGFNNSNPTTAVAPIITPYVGMQLGDNVLVNVFYSHWELQERVSGNVNTHELRTNNAAGITAHYLLRFDNLLLDAHGGTRFAGSDARNEEIGQLAQWRAGLDMKYKWNSCTFLLGAEYVEDYREYVGYDHRTDNYAKNEMAVRAGVDYALSDGLGLKFDANKSFLREKYTQYGADLQLRYRF